MSRLPLVAPALAALLPLLLPTSAPADPIGPGGTLLVGAAAPGVFAPLPTPVDYDEIEHHAVSQDGRYVVFRSRDDGLVADDDDRVAGVYRKDRQTGAVMLVSRATTGDPNHADCFSASISDDGSRVAFVCDGPLDPADTNGMDDIYVRDLGAGTTTLITRSPTTSANGASKEPQISGDGAWVAFTSSATNLAPLSPSNDHVYRAAATGGSISLVDRPNGPSAPNATADQPTISTDGDRVAFRSYATNLTATPDTNGYSDIYLRVMSAGVTTPVSTVNGNATVLADHGGFSPSISGNGAYVAYGSPSTNVVPADTDMTSDVYRRSLDGTAAVVLVSRATGASGAKGDDISSDPEVDATGQWIAFRSEAMNFATVPNDRTQAYLRHLGASPTTELVSRAAAPTDGSPNAVSLSADASTVAFDTVGLTPDSDLGETAIFARSVAGQTTDLVSRPPGADPFVNLGADTNLAGPGALSADGRYAVYSSRAVGLPGNQQGVEEVWRRDTLTGDVVLVSRADGAAGAPAPEAATEATISADGNRVAFLTMTSLTPELGVVTPGVYVRDIAAGTTTLASRADGPSGAPILHAAEPFLAAGGARVAFTSDSARPGDAWVHVLVRDLAAGATTLMGADQNADGHRPRLDAAGDRVAWSTATSGMTSTFRAHARLTTLTGTGHAYWADIAGSAAPQQLDAGAPDDTGAVDATLDDAGAHAAFTSDAALVPEDQHQGDDVYVRDIASGAVALVSSAAGGGAADGDSGAAAISGDGRAVAFLSTAKNLVADDANGALDDVFVRDLAAGTTTLASRADGAAGAAIDAQAEAPALSRDGGCALYGTTATTLAPGLSPFVMRAWLRAVHGPCPILPPPGGGRPGGGGPTTVPPPKGHRPAISKLRARPARFPVRGRKAGTRLSLHVDRAASVRIVIARLVRGHRSGRRCVPGKGKAKRCTIARPVVTLHATAKRAGTVTLHFTGRVRRKPIARGAYRATATASNAAGTSKAARAMLYVR